MTFGEKMRALMTERGLSLRALARIANYNPGYLSQIANGRRTPSLDAAKRLDDALDAEGELIALRRPKAAGPCQAAPQPRTSAEVLSHFLPDGDLSARMDALTGRRASSSTVTAFSARVHALRLADDVLAGGDLLAPAFRELDTAVRAYRETTHTDEVGRQLLAIIGEFAQIAGWIASDAGKHERAAETYRLGISAAREAGDSTLESNLTGSLAYQIANISDPSDAVPLAEHALTAAGPEAPPRARALAWDRIAWAHARTQNAPATMNALAKASEALSEHHGQDDPGYLYWVDGQELQIMEARSYTELRRPLRAVPLLTDVLSRYNTTHTRELALYLSWLAIALADANEPEEAAAAAQRMLDLSADLSSDRTTQRARTVLTRLERYRDVPQVHQVLEQHRRSA